MTQDFNIQSVAIVGAGAAGLTTLFELLHTKKDGSTTIAYDSNGEIDKPKIHNTDPAFTKIVSFEQNSQVGGIWSPSFDDPDVIPQELFDTEKYDDPWVLKPKINVPIEISVEGQNYSHSKPLVTGDVDSYNSKWAKSGIYRHLFSNVPGRYLRTSFIPYRQHRPSNSLLHPLVTNYEVTDGLLSFVKRFDLQRYIKLSSEIVEIIKVDNKWRLTIKETSGDKVRWYTELFDGVIVSTGHYSIPYLPRLPGLSKWNANYKSSVFHSKSFRDPSIFKDKNVLFVGTGLSGLDILQYAFPIARSVTVSRSVNKQEIYPWLSKAAVSDGIIVKPHVEEFKPDENRKIIFEDGTSIENVDYVVFSTGYHWHYPFLNEKDTGVSVLTAGHKRVPDGSSMVDGLFLNIFTIRDPTLTFNGVTLTPLKWPSFEITASAIAGVWTNKTRLPSSREQLDYSDKKKKDVGQNLVYHYYPPGFFKEYVEQLRGYLPNGRNPSDIYDTNHLDDLKNSFTVAENLFYQYKGGRLPITDSAEYLQGNKL